MRSPARIARRLATITLLSTLVAVAVAPPAEAGRTVPAATYVKRVCTAIDTFNTGTSSAQKTSRSALRAYQAQPSQDTARALRRSMVAFFQSARHAFAVLAASVGAAGTPDGDGGARFAKALTKAFRSYAAPIGQLLEQAQHISTASAQRFGRDVQALLSRQKTIADRANKRALAEAAITHAPTVFQPIVRYMTTDATSCASS